MADWQKPSDQPWAILTDSTGKRFEGGSIGANGGMEIRPDFDMNKQLAMDRPKFGGDDGWMLPAGAGAGDYKPPPVGKLPYYLLDAKYGMVSEAEAKANMTKEAAPVRDYWKPPVAEQPAVAAVPQARSLADALRTFGDAQDASTKKSDGVPNMLLPGAAPAPAPADPQAFAAPAWLAQFTKDKIAERVNAGRGAGDWIDAENNRSYMPLYGQYMGEGTDTPIIGYRGYDLLNGAEPSDYNGLPYDSYDTTGAPTGAGSWSGLSNDAEFLAEIARNAAIVGGWGAIGAGVAGASAGAGATGATTGAGAGAGASTGAGGAGAFQGAVASGSGGAWGAGGAGAAAGGAASGGAASGGVLSSLGTKLLTSAVGSVVSGAIGGGGGGGSGAGGAAGAGGINYGAAISNLLGIANSSGESAETQAAAMEAAQFLQERTNKTAGFADALGARADALMDRSQNRAPLPSQTGDLGMYGDALYDGPNVGVLRGNMDKDRAGMEQAFQQAMAAAQARVPVNEYSTAGVADEAAKKFARQSGMVDRANAIAASSGFAQALRGGVADSTAGAAIGNDITRKFADVYSKLSADTDTQALAENADKYRSYLSGKQLEVDQNSRLAQVAGQLFGTQAQVASNSVRGYTDAAAGNADRFEKAINMADTAALKGMEMDDSTLRAILAAMGGFNSDAMKAAAAQQAIASGAAKEASKTNGDAWARLADSALGRTATSALDGFVKNMFSGGASGAGSSALSAGDYGSTVDYASGNSWWPSAETSDAGGDWGWDAAW